MKICEILSVGTELLLGDVVDTNSAFLSRELRRAGYAVYRKQTCGDHPSRLAETLRLALSRSDLVLITGGLGPTYDDITREVTAEVLGKKLLPNREAEDAIRAYFARRGIPMRENNLRQAMVPEGGRILRNDWGTAPGLWLQEGEKAVVLLPGVPSEMKNLFRARVLPRLEKESGKTLVTRILKFYGISESALDEILSEPMRNSQNPTLAPYAGKGEVELHVTASAETSSEAEALCRRMTEEIRPLVGSYCYGEGEESSLERELVERLSQKGVTVATAESCTGGLVSQRITSVPGSSAVLALGVCAYSEEIKESVLGVPREVLERFGVYSRECALAMAHGVRKLAGSHVGIGITGIAGPGGETEEDPVGCVYIAVVSENKEEVERCVFGHRNPPRETVRSLAASKALAMTMHHCNVFCFFS